MRIELPIIDVAHLFLLRQQVALESLDRFNSRRDSFHNPDAGSFECLHFLGVVGHEANCFGTEFFKDSSGYFKLAAVGFVAKFEIRLDGVASVILQFIGAELRHQADAAAFLQLIHQHAAACFADGCKGEFQLGAAIAADGSEDVASEALRVDANDRSLFGSMRGDVAHHQGNDLFYLGRRGMASVRQA